MDEDNLLFKMPWPEVKDALGKCDVVLLPVGSIEQHGLHLPIDNDVFTAFEIAKRLADWVKVPVAHPIPFGNSSHHMNFPGTITLKPETLNNLYKEVCKCLILHGFRKIIIINGHGGNRSPLNRAIREIREETGAFVALINWWEPISDVIDEIKETKLTVAHACEMETSVSWYLGQNARMEKAKSEVPKLRYPSEELVKYFSDHPPKIVVASNTDERSKTGTLGDPTKATKKKGEIAVNALIERLIPFVRDLKKAKI